MTFTPLHPGVRYGAVRLLGSDGATAAVAYLQGTGTGPIAGLPLALQNFPETTSPLGLAVDSSGNLYSVAYSSGYTVYNIFTKQSSATSSVGAASPNGIALDGAGNLYVSDSEYGTLTLRPLSGSYDTPTTIATGLRNPNCVALDGAGNVYVADSGNNRILRESFSAESYTQTVIGSGFSNPFCVAVDSKGNVFVSDTGNNRVVQLAPSGGGYAQTVFPTTVNAPSGLAVDPLDNLFIGDNGNNRILKEVAANGPYSESVYVNFDGRSSLGNLAVDSYGNLFAGYSGSVDVISMYGVLAPATVQFNPANVGTASSDSPESVIVTNLGNAPLTFSAPQSGVNPAITSSFQLDSSSTCPRLSSSSSAAMLTPNASCTDKIDFVPVTSGNLSGTLTQTDNTLNLAGSAQVIANLIGTGQGGGTPAATLTPSAAFGSVQVGSSATQVLTLTNPGTAALSISSFGVTAGTEQFTQSSTTCTSSLAANSSCTFTIIFMPNGAGAQSGSFAVTDAVGTQTSALSGTGTPAPAPQAALTPAAASFGSVTAGSSSAAQAFTLANAGNAALTITSVSIGGANAASFAQTNTCGGTLAASATCTISVTFSPGSVGSFAVTLTVLDNASSGMQTSSLTGTGVAPGAPAITLTPATLSFVSTQVGAQSAAQTLTVANTGTASATLSSIALSGADAASFALTSGCGGTLAAGSSCTLSLTFSPNAARIFTAAVKVASNDPASPASASLAGVGAGAPGAALAPAALTFTSATAQTATLNNPGNLALSISGVTFSGTNASSFTLASDTCGASLAAGASCTLSIGFTGTASGSYAATLTVTDSASPATQTTALTGTIAGTAQAALTPVAVSFGSVLVGSANTAQVLTLSNPGSATLAITSITLGGSNPPPFTLTQKTCGATLAAGASCTVSVTLSSAVAGSFAATLSVVDSVGTQSSALSGTVTSTTPPDFTIIATPATQSSYRGKSVTYTIQLASLLAGNPFNTPVSLTAANLPAGATATFSPATVTPGTAPQTTMMTVTIPALSAANEPPNSRLLSPGHEAPSEGIAFAAVLLAAGLGRSRRRLPRLYTALLAFAVSAGLGLALTGCGAGNGFAVPTSTTTISITATGTGATHATTVTLTVQ